MGVGAALVSCFLLPACLSYKAPTYRRQMLGIDVVSSHGWQKKGQQRAALAERLAKQMEMMMGLTVLCWWRSEEVRETSQRDELQEHRVSNGCLHRASTV